MKPLNKIKAIAYRSDATLLQDAIGMMALVMMLLVGLYLPVLV